MLLDEVWRNSTRGVTSALAHDDLSIGEINEALQLAFQYGYADLVKILLQDARVNPGAPSNLAMDYSFAPSVSYSFALQQACYHGHPYIVSLLLADGRSDPSAGGFRCFSFVIEKAEDYENYHDILRQLECHCRYRSLDYQAAIGPAKSLKIRHLLAANSSDEPNSCSHAW